MEKLNIKIINKSNNLLPSYLTKGSVGFDIAANEDYNLYPQNSCSISTGLYMEIPDGYELQLRPRSGFANKKLVIIPNSPGTIDSDYRGEIKIGLYNLTFSNLVKIKKGDRIAQGILSPVYQANFIEVESLSETERGEGGFGHTGI